MRNHKTEARLNQLKERQEPFRFGSNYEPATYANRAEAPKVSWPSELESSRLCRFLQLMSKPERKAATLALYHPNLIEIHEQNLLWTSAHINPLSVLDSANANKYKPYKGTVNVADRLGYIDLHPTINVQIDNEPTSVPWPYQGDLLLFFYEDGIYRCVNWTVKKSYSDFLKVKPASEKKEVAALRKARARYEIEYLYYADVDIPSLAIAGDVIPDTLSANLAKLCFYSAKDLDLNDDKKDEILSVFKAGISVGTPPAVLISRLAVEKRCSEYEARTIFYQGVWNRELRLDLFSRIFIDRPPIMEETDVIEFFENWYKP